MSAGTDGVQLAGRLIGGPRGAWVSGKGPVVRPGTWAMKSESPYKPRSGGFFWKALFKIRAQPLTAHDASLCHKY